MTKYVINGGKRLNGEVTISGAKNAAVAIVPAALLVDGPCRIENVPKIIDVTLQLEILRELGVSVRLVNATTVELDGECVPGAKVPYELMRKIRASYYLIGALLGKYHHAEVAMPGGCNFGGIRPIDQHIKGFEALGAKISIAEGGYIHADAPNGLTGAHIYFDVVSVGATINIMLAAVLAKGMTVIENAAKEPHIVDLANFLNAMGANVKGAGTDVIKIRGVEHLHGGTYSIIPDQIEAGTFMAAVAACGGQALIKNVIPKHLECITCKLAEMGVEITEFDDAVLVSRMGKLTKTNVKTLPYPGFPTDMQPQLTTALCLAEGTSIITEGVWDNRYRYTEELVRMGANIHVDGKIAVVEGVPELTAAPVRAYDLRAGAAMVIAGLAAKGTTQVEQVTNIERGYENLVEKFVGLGADMFRTEIPDSDAQTMPVAK
ncbi:MAG: UDP-N-acetylglucosamine 1-carboxyvinyltransferase [Butyricicoccus sp.]